MTSSLHSALESLQQGHWVKLIGGASFQHLPSLRELALVYSLAGVDCIDVAADPAVIAAVREGMVAAQRLQGEGVWAGDAAGNWPGDRPLAVASSPLLMVSLNDGEDPHFRKAQFDPALCPLDCPRPCERVCPAQAIPALGAAAGRGELMTAQGVIESRCYGCGRCLPVCPIGNIVAQGYVSAPTVAMDMAISAGVQALEIHTQVGRGAEFERLWGAILPWLDQLQLVAVSCPGQPGPRGEILEDYLPQLYRTMAPQLECLALPLIWQTDGRPMSGDIGPGTTHAAIALAQRVLALGLPGFVQLAGGTNGYTVPKLDALGLLGAAVDLRTKGGDHLAARPGTIQPYIAGVAYGSDGRSRLVPILEQLEARSGHLEDFPDLLEPALALARELVTPLKSIVPAQSVQAPSLQAPLLQRFTSRDLPPSVPLAHSALP